MADLQARTVYSRRLLDGLAPTITAFASAPMTLFDAVPIPSFAQQSFNNAYPSPYMPLATGRFDAPQADPLNTYPVPASPTSPSNPPYSTPPIPASPTPPPGPPPYLPSGPLGAPEASSGPKSDYADDATIQGWMMAIVGAVVILLVGLLVGFSVFLCRRHSRGRGRRVPDVEVSQMAVAEDSLTSLFPRNSLLVSPKSTKSQKRPPAQSRPSTAGSIGERLTHPFASFGRPTPLNVSISSPIPIPSIALIPPSPVDSMFSSVSPRTTRFEDVERRAVVELSSTEQHARRSVRFSTHIEGVGMSVHEYVELVAQPSRTSHDPPLPSITTTSDAYAGASFPSTSDSVSSGYDQDGSGTFDRSESEHSIEGEVLPSDNSVEINVQPPSPEMGELLSSGESWLGYEDYIDDTGDSADDSAGLVRLAEFERDSGNGVPPGNDSLDTVFDKESSVNSGPSSSVNLALWHLITSDSSDEQASDSKMADDEENPSSQLHEELTPQISSNWRLSASIISATDSPIMSVEDFERDDRISSFGLGIEDPEWTRVISQESSWEFIKDMEWETSTRQLQKHRELNHGAVVDIPLVRPLVIVQKPEASSGPLLDSISTRTDFQTPPSAAPREGQASMKENIPLRPELDDEDVPYEVNYSITASDYFSSRPTDVITATSDALNDNHAKFNDISFPRIQTHPPSKIPIKRRRIAGLRDINVNISGSLRQRSDDRYDNPDESSPSLLGHNRIVTEKTISNARPVPGFNMTPRQRKERPSQRSSSTPGTPISEKCVQSQRTVTTPVYKTSKAPLYSPKISETRIPSPIVRHAKDGVFVHAQSDSLGFMDSSEYEGNSSSPAVESRSPSLLSHTLPPDRLAFPTSGFSPSLIPCYRGQLKAKDVI